MTAANPAGRDLGPALRPFRLADLAALDPPLLDPGQASRLRAFAESAVGPALTLEEAGRVLGCGGALVDPARRCGRLWVILGDSLRARPLLLHRSLLGGLPALVGAFGLRRLEARVLADYAAGRRWLQWLGFTDRGAVEDPLGAGEAYRLYVAAPADLPGWPGRT